MELKNSENTTKISEINESMIGNEILTRGFVSIMRDTRSVMFITLRDQLDTIQAIVVKKKFDGDGVFKDIKPESYVSMVGTPKIAKPLIFGCTIQNIEIEVSSLKILGHVYDDLPFSMKDAGASKEERAQNSTICEVGYNIRLDNRFLDFRMPQTQAIIRIMDNVMFFYRNFLRKNGFIEIKTTKIIQSGSEGGSNLFEVNYFDKKAFLAQSPQLYKQMAIVGGLKRVYEIGHVYRAEQSNINRYLSEFTGLDFEMELDGSYLDLIKFIHSVLISIFDSIKDECNRELEIIRKYRFFEDIKYNQTPVIITHREGVDKLIKEGVNISYKDDFSRENEKILGSIIKEEYGVDLFVVKDYPASERAFYTYVDELGATRSYDFILRGEEILSGAQRQTDYNKLKDAIIRKGISVESLSNYLEPFKFGPPPHGGCGIGFERLLKAYLNFDDIRYFSLFPRDPNRLYP